MKRMIVDSITVYPLVFNILGCHLFVLHLIFSICLLTSCSPQTLSLHTDYVGVEQYASFYVKTPDPHLLNPDIGQRLVIHWSVPKHYPLDSLHLNVTVRYFNRTEKILAFPITQRKGTKNWYILNEDFEDTQGIATYKAELYQRANLLTCWKHALWNETISIGSQAH